MIRFAFLLVTLCLAVAPAHAQPAASPPPLAAYAADPDADSLIVSPDGARLAYLHGQTGSQRLIVERQDGGAVYAGALGDTRIAFVQWYSPRHILIVSETTTDAAGDVAPTQTFSQVTVVDVDARTAEPLLRRHPGVMGALNGTPSPATIDGRPAAIMPAYDIANQQFSVFAAPLDGGWARRLDGGDFNTRGHVVGPTGDLVARAQFDGGAGVWRLQARRNGRWTDVFERRATVAPRLEGLGDREDTVRIVGDFAGGQDVQQIDLATGAVASLSLAGSRATSSVRHPQTLLAIGLNLGGERAEVRFDDPALQRRWTAVARAFPRDEVRLRSLSDDLTRATIWVDGPTQTGETFLSVDLARGRVEPLTDARPALAGQLGPVRSVAYQASDGLALDGILTLPPGGGRNLPLVVLVRSGPGGSSDLSFHWLAQALASRGYATLRPNHRGSTVSPERAAAGDGQWGRGMQTDLSDGVARLAADGVIDPRRVCIAGSGYGGYAALAGVTMQRGLYRCAVSINGISDLPPLLRVEGYTRGPRIDRVARWRRYLGLAASASPRDVASLSPLTHAAQAEAPVLLIHGTLDGEVPVSQSRRMRDALRSAGKPVDLVEIAQGDEDLDRPAWRLQALEATVAFIQRHNPATP